MKKWIPLVLLALAQTGHAFYETLSLADGTSLTNVFVTRVEPDGLSYMHDQGVTKVFFHELSEEIRQRYHYDPVLAVTYWYYTQQAQQDWEQRQMEAARLEAEEHQKRLDEIKLKEDALKSGSTARTRNLRLIHMLEDGSWLCRPFQYEKGGFTTGRAQYHKVFEEIQIIVEGLPDNMADQDEWRGRIYEVGIHQIKSESSTIRTFRKYRVIP